MNTITKETVVDKLASYLGYKLTLVNLVDWAEDAIQERTFEEKNAKMLVGVIGRIGVADVPEKGQGTVSSAFP